MNKPDMIHYENSTMNSSDKSPNNTTSAQCDDSTKGCTLNIADMHCYDDLKDLCIKNVPFWSTVSRSDIAVEKIAAAYTNDAYKVSLRANYDTPGNITEVMIKKISPYKSILFDIDDHTLIAELLGNQELGPKIVGKFQGGVIQKWIKGAPVTFETIHNISTLASLARFLGRFHRIGTEIAPKHLDRTPMILRLLDRWSKKALDTANKHNLDLDVEGIINGISVYKRALNKHLKNSHTFTNSVVFCHNDPGYRNVIDTGHGKCFIDFEYSGFNYVGCEISRFFYEASMYFTTGVPPYLIFEDPLDIDYTHRSLFVSVYLSEVLGKNVLPSDKTIIDEFLTSLQIHSLGVYLYCALWRVTM